MAEFFQTEVVLHRPSSEELNAEQRTSSGLWSKLGQI